MRKYLNIFKAEFMTNVQYSLNIALGAIGYLIFVVTFYYVWQYINKWLLNDTDGLVLDDYRTYLHKY